jgi:hypothetical protein
MNTSTVLFPLPKQVVITYKETAHECYEAVRVQDSCTEAPVLTTCSMDQWWWWCQTFKTPCSRWMLCLFYRHVGYVSKWVSSLVGTNHSQYNFVQNNWKNKTFNKRVWETARVQTVRKQRKEADTFSTIQTKCTVRVFRLLQQCTWGFSSCGIWCCSTGNLSLMFWDNVVVSFSRMKMSKNVWQRMHSWTFLKHVKLGRWDCYFLSEGQEQTTQ